MASEEFIREVDEELQRDRMALLWKRYGSLLIGVAVLIVAGTAGKVGWDYWQDRQLQQQGEQFAAAEQALAAGEIAAATAHYGSIEAGFGSGPGAVARLREAYALIEADEPDAALETLDQLASNTEADPLLRSLARLLGYYHRFDSEDPTVLAGELASLAEADQPWHFSARELRALALLRAGSTGEARDILAGLSNDAATPAGIRSRAEELLASLGGPPPTVAEGEEKTDASGDEG